VEVKMASHPRIGPVTDLVARRILRTHKAAEYVGLSASKLEKMRLARNGPRFVRLGSRAVGYDIRDLDAWLDAQREH